MCLAQGPQRSDAGEARTRGLSVSSQALYTAESQRSLPFQRVSRYLQWYVFDFESKLPIQNLVSGAYLRRQVGLFVFLKNMLFFVVFFVCVFFFDCFF